MLRKKNKAAERVGRRSQRRIVSSDGHDGQAQGMHISRKQTGYNYHKES